MILYRLLLCDYDMERINNLESMIGTYMLEKGIEYTLFKFGNPDDLIDYLNSTNGAADLIITAESFQNEAAIPFVKNLKDTYNDISTVMIGECTDKIEDLFEARMSYFLLTPTDYTRITRCLKTIFHEIATKNASYIKLKSRRGITLLDKNEIWYIASDKRKIIIHTDNNEFDFYMKLDDLAIMLEDGFIRSHQSFLVNMDKIVRFTSSDLILQNGECVPISEKRYYSAKREYLNYITKII